MQKIIYPLHLTDACQSSQMARKNIMYIIDFTHFGLLWFLVPVFTLLIGSCVWQDGETALYQAVDNGQEECVLALLEAGCKPNILTMV